MSIYQEIGGHAAVTAAVDVFYEKVLADPELSHYFVGVRVEKLKGHQRAFFTTALGGPDIYRGKDMAAAHDHLGITDDAFGRVVEHLVATLTELGVPGETIGKIGEALAPLQSQVVSVPAPVTAPGAGSVDQ